MSLLKIEAVINNFLTSDEPQVICITGKWGVGKTYEWDRLLKKSIEERKITKKKYSYVTLFGLNSLDDAKSSIFENTVSGEDLTTPPDESTYFKRIKEVRKAGSFGVVSAITSAVPWTSGSQKLIHNATFLFVKDQIVCFDDIERAGDGLKSKDILGLASLLKEKRRCKVVILLNQDELGEEKEEFQSALEKVADISLTFQPTASEAMEIAFEGNDTLADLMMPHVVNLGISNIRVLRKLRSFGELIYDLFSDYNNLLIQESISTLVLAGWSILQPRTAVPIEFIEEYNSVLFHMAGEENSLDEVEAGYKKKLDSFGFVRVDDIGSAIIQGVRNGYFDEDQLLKLAEISDSQHRMYRGSVSKVWNEMYRGTLAIDDEEFANELYQVTLSELRSLAFSSVNVSVKLIRSVLGGEKANFIIYQFLDICAERGIEALDPLSDGLVEWSEIDEELRDAFQRRYDDFVDERHPLDVIGTLRQDKHPTKYDVRFLSRLSANDFVEVLETLKGEQVSTSVYTLSRLASYHRDENPKLKENIEAAFEIISAKSPLRRRKIEQFRR